MRRVNMLAKQGDAKTLGLGFRVEWLSGMAESDDVEFTLTAGAGVGSPYLILSIDVDGETVNEYVDMRLVVTDWVNDIVRDRQIETDPECPVCGQGIQFCQGHGELGDPEGFRRMEAHEAGDHAECHEACDEKEEK